MKGSMQSALRELTAASAAERVATGFMFTEGPLWLAGEGCLLFSDMPADVRRRYVPGQGVTEVMRPSNKCNGMTLDDRGNLIVCEHSTSSVVLERADGTRETIASRYEGKELNSPNDVVVSSDGAVYFSDPTYGRTAGFGVERDPELSFQGVFRASPDGGELRLLADDFDQPNGLCFSPDESRLYVNDTGRAHVRVFEVAGDGGLTAGSVFADGIGEGDPNVGVVDGMKVDERGSVYVTGPGGVWVFDPDANHLGVLELPDVCANLNWAEAGWSVLYFAASSSLYRLPMSVAGNRLGYMRGDDG
jgi:gluconolactonase